MKAASASKQSFFIGTALIITGMILAALNIPSGLLVFGTPKLMVIGGICIISGIIALLIGLIAALLSRDTAGDERRTGIILNGVSLGAIVILLASGWLVFYVQKTERDDRMKKYNDERSSERFAKAGKIGRDLLTNLIDKKIIVINCKNIDFIGSMRSIGPYTAIAIPQQDSFEGGDAAIERIQKIAACSRLHALEELMNRDARGEIDAILDFSERCDSRIYLSGIGASSIKSSSELFADKDKAIQSIQSSIKYTD